MDRLAVSLSAFALIFVMMVNIALFVQNNQLRTQASAAPAPADPGRRSQAAPEQIDQLSSSWRAPSRIASRPPAMPPARAAS